MMVWHTHKIYNGSLYSKLLCFSALHILILRDYLFHGWEALVYGEYIPICDISIMLSEKHEKLTNCISIFQDFSC